MKFQIVSDLHLDFHRDNGKSFIKSLPVAAPNLIIAGDIGEWHKHTTPDWFEQLCAKWTRVYYVMGNHDYYGITENHFDGLKFAQLYKHANLFILNNDVSHILWKPATLAKQAKKFVVGGSTLWFKPSPYDPRLADYIKIPDFERRLKTWYQKSKDFVQLYKNEVDIMVTHHLPHRNSIADADQSNALNKYFYNPIDDEVEFSSVKLWVHGHTHTPCDYMVDGTRVVCNPLGYPGEYGTAFNPELVVDVQ